ncbi:MULTISPECIES: very short patch repair endonuclease [unclassified Bradyrhizobium]
MVDTHTGLQRRRNMQAIRSTNTRPELVVRSLLHARGFRYRLHVRSLPGRPDIVLKRYRTAIFVHGCFWHQHGCPRSSLPKSRKSYWHPKLSNNVERHKRQVNELRALGWRVITIWECEVDTPTLARRLRTLFKRQLDYR